MLINDKIKCLPAECLPDPPRPPPCCSRRRGCSCFAAAASSSSSAAAPASPYITQPLELQTEVALQKLCRYLRSSQDLVLAMSSLHTSSRLGWEPELEQHVLVVSDIRFLNSQSVSTLYPPPGDNLVILELQNLSK